MALVLLCGAVAAYAGEPAFGEDTPLGGEPNPSFRAVDDAVIRHMQRIDARAAVIAISRNGKILYTQGYGWFDADRTTPTPPDTLMRIASVSKPIASSLAFEAIRSSHLAVNAPVLEVLGAEVEDAPLADKRWRDITVDHLLKHQGGWDGALAGDPMFQIDRVERAAGLDRPANPSDVVEYMLGQPLQFAPGERTAYANVGYCILGRVLERARAQSFSEILEEFVTQRLGTRDIVVGRDDPALRHEREVDYPPEAGAYAVDVLDAAGGMVASAPALTRYLDRYWITGARRNPFQNGEATFYGSLPGTSAMVRQRPDRLNVAVLFNNRRDAHIQEDLDRLRRKIDEAITESRR
ncbi:MAG: serine hydrolase domain-containing protein [Planctomycetota bacterium]